jgi:hypothetical protein
MEAEIGPVSFHSRTHEGLPDLHGARLDLGYLCTYRPLGGTTMVNLWFDVIRRFALVYFAERFVQNRQSNESILYKKIKPSNEVLL